MLAKSYIFIENNVGYSQLNFNVVIKHYLHLSVLNNLTHLNLI